MSVAEGLGVVAFIFVATANIIFFLFCILAWLDSQGFH